MSSTSVTVYAARAKRSGAWWAVSIDDVAGGVYTQGRTLREARRMAADAIATVLDVPLETVAVDLAVEGTTHQMQALHDARDAARTAARAEDAALHEALAALLGTGMSQHDAGDVLGLSHQRISQLTQGARKPRPDEPKRSARRGD